MDDLISRQAAIDAIKHSEFGFEVDAIEQLPAVQPQPEIIRCKDCRYYKAYDYTGYLACHLVVGGTVRRDLDDFCSRAERRTDG